MIKNNNFYYYLKNQFNFIYSDIYEFLYQVYDEFCYFIIFVDDLIRTIFARYFIYRNQIFKIFKNFIIFIKKQFDAEVKKLCSDNANKYADAWFNEFMKNENMLWKLTMIFNSHKNDIVKKIN